MKNRIEVSGYLTAKPERRFLPSGAGVANARLGESYSFEDSSGKQQRHTNWHSLTFYGGLANVAGSLDKGDHLFVQGSIEQREFTPRDGAKRTVWELIVQHCHLIAPPRDTPAAKATAVGASQETATHPGKGEDKDAWPVG